MIKYSDKINCTRNKLFYSKEFGVKEKSLKDAVDAIANHKKYAEKCATSDYICIDIEGVDSNNKIFLDDVIVGDVSVLDFKKLISAIAFKRSIAISTDLSEIQHELLFATNITNLTSTPAMFDYPLIYGDYENFDGCTVEIPKLKDCRNPKGGTIFTACGVIHPANSIVTSNMRMYGVYCMYSGIIWNEHGDVVGDIDMGDAPIPPSLYKLIKRR